VSAGAGMAEPALYRPFAVIAFAAAVLGGTPLGLWMLAWLYRGAPATPARWVLLHASLQIFGFFATLIPGVAQHLVARFTGRPVARHPLTRPLAALLAAGVALRVAGTWVDAPAWLALGALAQAAAFSAFGWWGWRALDPPPLAVLRRHLTLATAWLAAACLLELLLRGRALAAGAGAPDLGAMRAVHAMAIYGGVLGWVTGVLLRAGPMFVADWRLAPAAQRALAPLLALGALLAAAGELGDWPGVWGPALARLGESLALATVVGALALGGAFRRAPRGLPMLSRSPAESRIFRLAVAALTAATAGALAATLAALAGRPAPVLTDAVRHLVTVGFLTAVVVAMAFRLLVVLEGRPLAWPRLRALAFWALLGGVLLRTAEVLVAWGLPGLAPWVPLSGLLVWAALACVAANLVAAVAPPRR